MFSRPYQQGDAPPDQQPAEPQPAAEGGRAALQEEAQGDADGDQQGGGPPSACRTGGG